MGLKGRIEGAIEEYNRYRDPEAKARLLTIENRAIKIEFTGPFCSTCGFYDYFDDLRWILEERGVRARIGRIEEIEDGAIVEFHLF